MIVSAEEDASTAPEAPEGLRSKLANWSELSVDERRTVLTALHHRVAEAGREGKLQVRSERRFGYRVQRPDGTVVRIERRQAVVQFRDAEGQSFGVGFEQRSARLSREPGGRSQSRGMGAFASARPSRGSPPCPRPGGYAAAVTTPYCSWSMMTRNCANSPPPT